MTTTEITYRDETYTCRVLSSNDGEPLIIAGLKLLDALMPYPMTDFSNAYISHFIHKFASFSIYWIMMQSKSKILIYTNIKAVFISRYRFYTNYSLRTCSVGFIGAKFGIGDA